MLGLWWEDGFAPRRAEGFVDAMRDALRAYLRFAGATRARVGVAPRDGETALRHSPLGRRQRALEGGPVVRAAVRREHVLDRQLEQRAQPGRDLLARGAGGSHRSLISSPWPKSTSVSPEITARLLSIQCTVSLYLWPR